MKPASMPVSSRKYQLPAGSGSTWRTSTVGLTMAPTAVTSSWRKSSIWANSPSRSVTRSKKLSSPNDVLISKPALLLASGVMALSVAWITTAMNTTVVMIMANMTMAIPVRKRLLRG